MPTTREGWVTMSDGHKLYEKVWTPDDSVQSTAHLIFLHGFSDHCNAYYDFFPTLSSPPYNIVVHAIDQRGWGRSVRTPNQKGLTGSTIQVRQDISDYISHVSSGLTQEQPAFLMGHSMGGQEALHYLLSCSHLVQISGLLLESPYIALDPKSQPSSLTVALGMLASFVLPHHQMLQKLDPALVCRDPKIQKEWSDDPLCHDMGTLQGLSGMLQRARDLDRLGMGLGQGHAPKGLVSTSLTRDGEVVLPCPVWWAHGTEDKVTSYDASRRLFDRVQVVVPQKLDGDIREESAAPSTTGNDNDKTFVSFRNGFHKLHAEPEGMAEDFARQVGEWIVRRTRRERNRIVDDSTAAPAGTDTVSATAEDKAQERERGHDVSPLPGSETETEPTTSNSNSQPQPPSRSRL